MRWGVRREVRWGVRRELEVGRLLRINQGGATVVLLREVSLEARRAGGWLCCVYCTPLRLLLLGM